MLHLAVRPELPDPPTANRNSIAGLAALRQAVQNLAPSEFVAAQLDWLQRHPKEAFGFVASVSKGPSATGWAEQQFRSLAEADDLVTSRGQLLTSWRYLRRVLGEERFLRHVREALDRDSGRRATLAGITLPSQALDAITASEAEKQAPYLREVEEAAAKVLSSASSEDWEAAFKSSATEPLLSLALRLTGSSLAPKNPSGLQEALHAHFSDLADDDGEAALWQPDGATFARVTRLLNAPARKVLASQFCAELEGRDGQVGPHLLQTYGDFLAEEAGFRSHQKLPNVVERFLAREDWSFVGWFVDLARKHDDALDEKGRREEMQHLREKVGEKLDAAGSSAPVELIQLAELFGLELPESEEEESEEEAPQEE